MKSKGVYRVDYGRERFIECGELKEPEKGEHYYVLIGFPDSEPVRLLLESQDFRSFKNFFRVCENKFGIEGNMMDALKKQAEEMVELLRVSAEADGYRNNFLTEKNAEIARLKEGICQHELDGVLGGECVLCESAVAREGYKQVRPLRKRVRELEGMIGDICIIAHDAAKGKIYFDKMEE